MNSGALFGKVVKVHANHHIPLSNTAFGLLARKSI